MLLKRFRFHSLVLILILFGAAASSLAADPRLPLPPSAQSDLASQIDAILAKTFKPGEPGAAVLVKKGGQVLFRRGYGLANLELNVPVKPDMVFRLGSITKQFTAAAVLMLAEQGKLSLQDDISKFLPDFPTQGRAITVEHLLTHTSGIKGYTEIPGWLALWRKDMSVKEIIDLFRNVPLEFEPGQKWKYSNSGYILLGAIIEKISGQSYEDFVNKNIFGPLGLMHSCYDRTARIIPGRVPGYTSGRAGFENAQFISMTQPYAAGSLLSSVDDLAIWNESLLDGRLIKRETLERAFTSSKLTDGRSTGYGFGWQVSNYEGYRLIEHGGGIMGFTSYAILQPESRLVVAVLTNSAIAGRAPAPFAFRIAALALGKPYRDPAVAALKDEDLAPLPGVYVNADNERVTIFRQGGKVFSQSSGGTRAEIFPASPTVFFIKDSPSRFTFIKDEQGRVNGLTYAGRIGPAESYVRLTQAAPPERKEIVLDLALLGRYVGEYEIAPSFSLAISLEGNKLLAQPTGQPKLEIFPEAETKFFSKAVDAQVEFIKDASGQVTGLVLYQGGQKIEARKLK